MYFIYLFLLIKIVDAIKQSLSIKDVKKTFEAERDLKSIKRNK